MLVARLLLDKQADTYDRSTSAGSGTGSSSCGPFVSASPARRLARALVGVEATKGEVTSVVVAAVVGKVGTEVKAGQVSGPSGTDGSPSDVVVVPISRGVTEVVPGVTAIAFVKVNDLAHSRSFFQSMYTYVCISLSYIYIDMGGRRSFGSLLEVL